MALLNSANSGFHHVLLVLFRTLWSRDPSRPLEKYKLFELCVGSDGDQCLKDTFGFWQKAGFFIEKEGFVRIGEDYLTSNLLDKKLDVESAVNRLPLVLRRVIFDKSNTGDFWTEEGSLTGDIVRGLAWLLAQQVYEFNLLEDQKVNELEVRQLESAERILGNNVRRNALRRWVPFLGFARPVGGRLLIDPTLAIRDEISFIFGKKEKITAEKFVNELAVAIPVLDLGEYRMKVEERWKPSERFKSVERRLSPAFSFGIRNLEFMKIIELDYSSDTGNPYQIIDAENKELKSFTHVRRPQVG